MRVSITEHEELEGLSLEKKSASDKTGDAPFQQGSKREKSKLIKNNEQAIKEYRTSFEGESFVQRAKSRGMSMLTKPVQLKNIVGEQLDASSEFVPPVFAKSDEEVTAIQSRIVGSIFFNDLAEQEERVLIDAFEPVTMAEGDIVIREGDKGDYFYVILEGKVTFLVKEKIVGDSKGGSQCFGELALLYTSPRAATVRCDSSPTKMFRVDQKTFRSLLQKQSQAKESEKMGLLRSIDFFTDIDDRRDLKRLSAAMKPRAISPGDQLTKAGIPLDVFYIVVEGELEVTNVTFGTTRFEDVKVTKGSYFGERVLSSDEPISANITVTKAGMVFYIDKPSFEKVMGQFSRVVLRAQYKSVLEEVDLLIGAKLSTIQFEDLADYVVDKEFKADEVIFCDEEDTEAAMYIIRRGSVKLTGEGIHDIVKSGGYFGESLLLLDNRQGSMPKGKLTPRFSAKALEQCHCGVLYLSNCRFVFDTGTIPDLHGENRYYLDNVGLTDSDDDDEGLFGAAPSSLTRETTKQWLRNTSSDLLRSVVKTNVQLADLEKHSVLGEGQFGEVWLVSADLSDPHSKQFFALKSQHKEDDSRGDSIDFIRREIDILQAVDHPFLITYVHEYDDPDKIYILMRLVYGGELFDVIHYKTENGKWSSGIPEDHAKFYAMMIADTLEYMHRKQFVYRDMKAENVLIDRDGYPVICDFGFAKYVEDLTYTMCGTPNFLSPEAILQKGHNHSTDHWALGVLIYEMIAGENPFFYDGMPQMELFEAILQDRYYPLPDEVSDDAFEVVDELLVKDPTQRLGSLAGGGKDIINKAWFRDLDLVEMRQKRHRAPFIPHNKELDEKLNKAASSAPPKERQSASHSELPVPGPPATITTFTDGGTVKFGNVRKKRVDSLLNDCDSDSDSD
ncbi:unnamed protein product [Cylindrotheca closterium]|uniref:cGMP-dependent protein kinase n=1 Tax=Cylindrotheca closterium TaxID=2856 RepID=A0AAD2FLT4_9STRA|nr:unnamed protein product [Cylindrotheca closterium]